MRRRLTEWLSESDRAAPPVRVRALLVLVAVVGLLLGPASAASAHDDLVSSDPADGAVLTVVPTRVVLTFTADQLAVGSAVAVTGADGAAWSEGDTVVATTTVTQPLRAGMTAGAYTVEWRSVSADGHPISGTFSFALDLPEPVVTPTPTPVRAPAPTTTATASAAVTATAATTPEPSPAALDDTSALSGASIGRLVVGLLVVAGVVTAVVLRRRGRSA